MYILDHFETLKSDPAGGQLQGTATVVSMKRTRSSMVELYVLDRLSRTVASNTSDIYKYTIL